MVKSIKRDSEIFWKQPEKEGLQSNIQKILEQFWWRTDKIIGKILTPEEREIVDKKIEGLRLKTNELIEKHNENILLAIAGNQQTKSEYSFIL